MDITTMIDVIITIQHMEERGIYVKDHSIEDAIGLVEFNRIIDNEVMMQQKLKDDKK